MWQSRDFRSVPVMAQLLFVCLINHADDDGRLKTDAEHISDTMLKILAPDIQVALDALTSRKMIVQYHSGGETYIALTNWESHQKISHRNASTYPAPPPKRIPERSGKIRNIPVSRAPADPDPDLTPIPTSTPLTEAQGLCEIFVILLTANGVRLPSPIPDAWLEDMDRLLRLDHRPLEEAEQVLRWSQQDSFWKTNIHSPGTFRKQYDKLRLKMTQAPTGNRSLTAGRDWLQVADSMKELGA